MTNKTEISKPSIKYNIPDSGWSYDHLLFMYKQLLSQYTLMIDACDLANNRAVVIESYASNLETDLKNTMEAYRKCHQAHRTVDGVYTEPTFKELNTPPLVPSNRIRENDV
jgi:hypothetical protein